MKKRLVRILSCSVVVIGLLSLSLKIVHKNEEKEKQKALTAHLPIFSFRSLNGNFVDNNLLNKSTPSVFIAFHPECEHCQYEAKSINDRQKDLSNTNIILFTTANDSLTKAFSQRYGLDTLTNVYVISDTTREMEKAFGVKGIPNIFIYNTEGKLLKQYKGETKIEAILKTLALPTN
jgi:thioredoxin-related protein